MRRPETGDFLGGLKHDTTIVLKGQICGKHDHDTALKSCAQWSFKECAVMWMHVMHPNSFLKKQLLIIWSHSSGPTIRAENQNMKFPLKTNSLGYFGKRSKYIFEYLCIIPHSGRGWQVKQTQGYVYASCLISCKHPYQTKCLFWGQVYQAISLMGLVTYILHSKHVHVLHNVHCACILHVGEYFP